MHFLVYMALMMCISIFALGTNLLVVEGQSHRPKGCIDHRDITFKKPVMSKLKKFEPNSGDGLCPECKRPMKDGIFNVIEHFKDVHKAEIEGSYFDPDKGVRVMYRYPLEIAPSHELASIELDFETDNIIGFGDNESNIVIVNDRENLKIWSAETGELLQTFSGIVRGRRSDARLVRASTHGSMIAIAYPGMEIGLWDMASGNRIRNLEGLADLIYNIHFSHDGTLIASGGDNGIVRLWDVKSGKELRALIGHKDQVRSIGFNHDGSMLASSSQDETVKIWDLKSGREIRTLVHAKPLLSVSFNHDGSTLATACTDQTIKLWDMQSGQEIHSLPVDTALLSSASFSPDGQILEVRGSEGTALWEVNSWDLIAVLKPVWNICFRPDGRTFLASTIDNPYKYLIPCDDPFGCYSDLKMKTTTELWNLPGNR